jgi:hypothetical protein
MMAAVGPLLRQCSPRATWVGPRAAASARLLWVCPTRPCHKHEFPWGVGPQHVTGEE